MRHGLVLVPVAAAALLIKATLAGSTRTVTVSVPGGPGPSIVDLPAPGCWTLHLTWSGHTDELKLRYVALLGRDWADAVAA